MDTPGMTAIALRYEPGDPAPIITASGKGDTAETILRLAREHDIPLRQDTALAGALAGLELGAVVPQELFRAVAEVLAWVYALEGEHSAKRKRPPVRVSSTSRAGH